ncbi:MAG: 50S ribosomal protein L1 [Candidatus Omnitrophica bacterium]|nr:50S ribosomal protein L1 [Candidatus Omnitrophota bacterium]MDD5236470.1 50S ribosomal protein L1 [Candidatus Omnitrophota bacterium]MDD5610841.1 50S ribosomal protein L1 [Candidatus Omnitrophota bacterium]
MKEHSKRYTESLKQVDFNKTYSLKEAISSLKKMPATKFDSSVDLHFQLGVDTKKPEEMVRGTVVLPHGRGKTVRVAVFCKGEAEKDAKEAGADVVGGEDLINKVSGGFMDFDYAVATPDIMKELSKLGKVLGPRGLMPSPKTGTLTNDVGKAVRELKKGKVEYKVDKQGGIHISIGKMSFDETKIYENASKVIEAINSACPATVKGTFIKNLSLASSMSPGFKIGL